MNHLVSFEAITALQNLKKRVRAGWVKRGVKNAESVADHSWRTGLMAYMLAPKGYDKEKMLKMALIHDATEIFEKDYAPVDGVTKTEKEKRERKAAEKFFTLLEKNLQNEFRALWEEFEARETKEAQFVKQIEILEMLFQALEYENEKKFKQDLTEWLEYEKNNRKTDWHPTLKAYFNEIDKRWPKEAKKKFDASKYKYYY